MKGGLYSEDRMRWLNIGHGKRGLGGYWVGMSAVILVQWLACASAMHGWVVDYDMGVRSVGVGMI